MANGFFREWKHYKLYEISIELSLKIEETKRLMYILKKYGIVKTVKSSKSNDKDLSYQDIIFMDEIENYSDIEYVFDFVGIVIVEGYAFKCYPKYIMSTMTPIEQLKQVLKVIKKYNEKSRMVDLYNGEADNTKFNHLAVALYLLEEYFQNGIYTNQYETIEINGEGEVLWDKTINETFVWIQNNRPYYTELQTRSIVDDEMDYIRRLHECVLTQCTRELKDMGILDLFDITEVELTNYELDSFGSIDYIKYRLEKEMQVQFVTRKQTLLKTMYAYIFHQKIKQDQVSFSVYGTNSFHTIWEAVCVQNFGSMLNWKLSELPVGISESYIMEKDKKLIDIIQNPIWHKNHPAILDDTVGTLRPDLVCIYPIGQTGKYCFGIYDAKYYCIDFKEQKNGYKVTGQPGVGDITKQYLYQLAYDDFIKKQGYQYVQNMFLCPQENAEPDYGYVEMKILHTIGDKTLENIAVVKLCAPKMYELYLDGKKIEHITEYIPPVAVKQMHELNFTGRMMKYLRGIIKEEQTVQEKTEIRSIYGKWIYPKQIEREIGAKLIYDRICSSVPELFWGVHSYEIKDGCMVAGNIRTKEYDLKSEQVAKLAIEIEKHIKLLSKQKLQDKLAMKLLLKQCLEEKKVFSISSENNLDKLVEKIMELVRELYL